MNPNSQNQVWSKWVWFVKPGVIKNRPFIEVQYNLAKFGRMTFGSPSVLKITQTRKGYIIEVITEGHPVQDPNYVEYMREIWEKDCLVKGFGTGTQIKMTAKLMAGSRQDGKPPDQMLMVILPPEDNVNG